MPVYPGASRRMLCRKSKTCPCPRTARPGRRSPWPRPGHADGQRRAEHDPVLAERLRGDQRGELRHQTCPAVEVALAEHLVEGEVVEVLDQLGVGARTRRDVAGKSSSWLRWACSVGGWWPSRVDGVGQRTSEGLGGGPDEDLVQRH